MSVEPWLAWLSFGISTALFTLGIISALTFGTGALGWARAGSADRDSNGAADGIPSDIAQLNFSGIASASRVFAVVAIVAASFALAYALSTTSLSLSASLAVAGASLASGILALAAAVSRFDIAAHTRTRNLVIPVGKTMYGVCSLPLVRTAITPPRIADASEPKSEDDALDDSLSLLEAAGISTDPGELEMIRAVLRLDRARVREIMQPRVDMVAAEASSPLSEITEVMIQGGHSRLPIFEETIDRIVGVVHAQDLLRSHSVENGERAPVVRDLARQALFVPEAQMLDQLLEEFQRARTQIAIVVDEYGGVSGLVTVQDLLEEIVGELVDEFDSDEPDVERISDVEIRLDARMPLETLRQELGVDIDGEGFDTVGGLVYRELGKMPSPGDRVAVNGIRLTVESTMGRRIRHVRVRRVLAPIDTTT